MFHKKKKFGGRWVLREQKAIFEKKGKLCERVQRLRFSAHRQAVVLLRVIIRPPFFVLRQALFLLQIFYLTHTNFPFPPHPYNVQLSFQTITCGVKHAPQLRFFAKPDFAFVLHFRFAPVQNMAVRICGTNKLLQKILIR